MSDEEIKYELETMAASGSSWFATEEREALKLACQKVERCAKYEKALLSIQSCESIQEINRIIMQAFDLEEQ